MLRLYNSLARKKQIFKPLRNKKVTIYSCGPTVYDYAHIGNFRSYIAWDLLHRFLEYSGYRTTMVENITDVGHFTDEDEDRGIDKLEKAAKKEKKDPLEIAKFYTQAFIQTEEQLNISAPDFRPKATGEIKTIQKIIQTLLKKGFAYDAPDGVYFDISRFPRYGKLSGNTSQKILSGARVEVNPNKKHPADFALWKKRVGQNRLHSLHWSSPWGDGFPGWHIECSAMAIRYLGKTIDIHTGGKDNKFPHHESEIAQSEAYTGTEFGRFWLHSNHVDVNGKKMSKSLGNIITLQDIVDKGFDPLAYRFWTLTAHYRSPLNFTWKSLEEASRNWAKIVDFYTSTSLSSRASATSRGISFGNKTEGIPPLQSPTATSLPTGRAGGRNDNNKYLAKRDQQFTSALNDDLNTPKAIALLLQVIKDTHKDPLKISAAACLIKKWDQVLGILPKKLLKKQKIAIPSKVKKLLAKRQKARKNKDFAKADIVRKQIEKLGFKITDKNNGSFDIQVR